MGQVSALGSHPCVSLDPKDAKIWEVRGSAFRRLGHWDKAVADFSRAIELDPNLAIAWYNRGHVYAEQGQPDQAIPDLSRAIELDPRRLVCAPGVMPLPARLCHPSHYLIEPGLISPSASRRRR
jgi:tetratricopeptide (TPR) repeat protein